MEKKRLPLTVVQAADDSLTSLLKCLAPSNYFKNQILWPDSAQNLRGGSTSNSRSLLVEIMRCNNARILGSRRRSINHSSSGSIPDTLVSRVCNFWSDEIQVEAVLIRQVPTQNGMSNSMTFVEIFKFVMWRKSMAHKWHDLSPVSTFVLYRTQGMAR